MPCVWRMEVGHSCSTCSAARIHCFICCTLHPAPAPCQQEPWCEYHCAPTANKKAECMQGRTCGLTRSIRSMFSATADFVACKRDEDGSRETDLQGRENWHSQCVIRITAVHSCQPCTSEAHKPMPLRQWHTHKWLGCSPPSGCLHAWLRRGSCMALRRDRCLADSRKHR